MYISPLARQTGSNLLRTHRRTSHPKGTSIQRLTPSCSLSTSAAPMFALSKFRGNPADQPKTFSRQSELPRLPIPKLEDTFERYIKSLEPILLQAEEFGDLEGRQTASSELQKRRTWAKEAVKEGSLVRKLQQRLIDVDRTSPDNWLDDRFWLQKAYHEWRVPLLVNSNWWLMMRADPNTPAAALEDPASKADTSGSLHASDDHSKALGTNNWEEYEWGIRRATWLTYRLLHFKYRVETEDIMPDASRAGAFCMHQYTKVFGITRIPAIPHDYNTATPFPAKAKHIVVVARNNFYKLNVLQEEDGLVVPLQEIEEALKSIVDDARKKDGAAVGVMTANGRDEWTRAREHFLSVSPRNREMVNVIEDALFTVCLDSSVLPLPKGHPGVAHGSTPASVDAHARNISGAGRAGLNRWFDKAVSIVVEPNGRAGLMGEHSPCDALIPSIVVEYALGEPCPPPSESLPSGTLPAVSTTLTTSKPLFEKMQFDIDPTTEANIAAAYDVARNISRESDIGELWFDEYGTNWIKKVAKQSPDAFLQQVLQLAFFKVKGFQVPTYETASTRLFKHGRTDVIRSFSRESYELMKAIRNKESGAAIYKLLSAATLAHNNQTKASSTGKGVDRHLTGLRLVYDANEDGALPNEGAESSSAFWGGAKLLFGDELLGQSQGWKLSTSGLSAGDKLAGTGFGSGYLDGYGINYLAGSNLLKFGIESKHPAPDGQGESGPDPTHQLSTAIVESLRFFREVCEKEAPAASEGSKL